MTTRRQILDAVKDAWSKARGGRYTVRLAEIDWLSWDYDAHPLAVSIVPAATPLELPVGIVPGLGPTRTLPLHMVAVARVPGTATDTKREVSENEQEAILLDLAIVIRDVLDRRTDSGKKLVHALGPVPDDAMEEERFPDTGLQGIAAYVPFQYVYSET